MTNLIIICFWLACRCSLSARSRRHEGALECAACLAEFVNSDEVRILGACCGRDLHRLVVAERRKAMAIHLAHLAFTEGGAELKHTCLDD